MRTKDDLLREALEASGYYQQQDKIVTLDENCDLRYEQQVSLLLAREVVRSRPDLLSVPDRDLVYIVCDSLGNFGLPSNDLTRLLEEEKPFDDCFIGVYSLSKRRLMNKLYKGNGVDWVPYHGASK